MIHPFVSKCIPDLIKLYGVYKLILWLHAQKEASAKKLACGQWEACIRSDDMIHYQKFAKYQRIYRRNIFCRYFEVEITDGHFPSVIQSVKTDENFSVRNSVCKYRRKNFRRYLPTELRTEKFSNLKKRRVADVEVLAGYFFPTKSPTNSKRLPVQCP